MASLLDADTKVTGGLPGLPHFPPKAKRVIYLFQHGAPSQLDLFDYKPKLAAVRGEELPDSVRMGQRREQACKDLYARKAGELAFLEAKLSLNAKQAPLFAHWKQASLDVAKQHESDCATQERRAGARDLP